ncbi:MAG: hypothetical protein A3H93_09390 [Rhodocyclales bacterium RIFCSPLOWO2_02_FULL_63_24]|nr:MAG: hypothetical protein A3H93_09390 [Rhodocyclales bacterium RIFCSPLOWO2_02_FULL_63_24]
MNWPLNRASSGAIAIALGVFGLLIGASLNSLAASAGEPAAANPPSGQRFATVWRIRGEVAASGAGNERKLREGDPVYVGERVRAAALAEAVLKTEDAGVVAIRPSTEFVAERFAAEDKPTDSLTVRLVTGSLRVISGWIARTNRSGHNIVTPSATIGIRGTDHEPYVLSAELAKATSNREGTYDKVNRGGTTMVVGDNKLDIDPGRVGFVRAPAKVGKEGKGGFKERALLTILLPVLLDKVPNFYVPGEFDTELDRYAQTADEDSLRQLEQRRKAPRAPTPLQPLPPKPAPTPTPTPTSAPAPAPGPTSGAASGAMPGMPSAATPGTASTAECQPTTIAKTWLGQLDAAIARNDAPAIVAMFAPEAAVRATIRGKDNKMTSVDLGREELAQSTLAAMKGLKDYKQRRVWTDGTLENAAAPACDRISLKSVVIEQGRQSGKPYRFESVEAYVLELRAGKWLAIKAETTQQ